MTSWCRYTGCLKKQTREAWVDCLLLLDEVFGAESVSKLPQKVRLLVGFKFKAHPLPFLPHTAWSQGRVQVVSLEIVVLLPESVQLALAKYQKLDLRAEGPWSSDVRQAPVLCV